MISIHCNQAINMSLTIAVPAPGAARDYATQVASAVQYSQVASVLAVGASSGSGLGRVMAVRSMVLCDADSAVGGGVIDLALTMCAGNDDPGSGVTAARSAIVSNVVLVVAVAAFLLVLVGAWAAVLNISIAKSLQAFCLPSSLLPVWTAVVPSTSASAALLFGRFHVSTCTIIDAILGICGIIIAMLPFALLLVFWATKARDGGSVLTCVSSPHNELDKRLHAPLRCYVAKLTRRAWRWEATTTHDADLKAAWVVLLEFRFVWYAALDSAALALVACVGVISGLGSTDSCHGWSIAAAVLMFGQLLVLLLVRPFTTPFSHVYGAASLGLTCASLTCDGSSIVCVCVFQHVDRWPLAYSSVCSV